MEKELKVNGMMCVNCQKHVHDALAAMAGVSAVDVNLEKGPANGTADREISQDEYKTVIEDAVYELA